MRGKIRGKTSICFVFAVIIAFFFISFPIKNILLGTYLKYLRWPQITQGLIEIIVVYFIGMAVILCINNKTLRSVLLILCSCLYLQNHQFLLPYLVGLFYIEMILSIGTAVRRIFKFEIQNEYIDYLSSFVFGVATWGATAIVFSFCGNGNFSWLRIVTVILFVVANLIYRRKPLFLYFAENCRIKNKKEHLFIYFLILLVLIQGAKSRGSFDYDSLWYGLNAENVLIGENSFYDNLGMLTWVHYFPKFFELFAAPLSDLNECSFIHAINICLYELLLLAVYKFFRDLRFCEIKALFYTIVVATVPTIANMSTTAKPDMFTAFFVVLAALYFFKATKENNLSYLSLAYASIILSMCGKISSYPYIAILFLTGTIVFIVMQSGMKNLFRKNNISYLLILGFSLIVLVGTFYRTYLLTGYPLYPFTVNLWKKMGFDGVYPFADYFGGRKAGFATGVVFNFQFYAKHIFNLLFAPNKISEYRANHITINWYGNFGIYLSIILLFDILRKRNKSDSADNVHKIISFLLLPVWVEMSLLAVFLFQYAQDGNYYIVPVTLGIIYLAYVFEQKTYEHKKIYYGIFTVFIALQFVIMFVSHVSWSLGTSSIGINLFKSSFDSYDNKMNVLKNHGVYDFEEYVAWQSYSNSRALGEGNEELFFRLSTGYEDVTQAMSMTSGIFDSEENLLKYLDWANINFLIMPKDNSDLSSYPSQYQNYINVFSYYQNLENVFEIDTEDYILLDITSYTDSSNRRKERYMKDESGSQEYRVWEEIIFASEIGNINSSKYVTGGLSTEEGKFCWTDAKEVNFLMKLEDIPEKELEGHLEVLAVQNDMQWVQIVVNGEVAWEGEVTPGIVEFPIKCQERIQIDIKIPNAQSEKDAGTGLDERELGLAITKMWIGER